MSIDQYLSRALSKTLGEQGIINPRGANVRKSSLPRWRVPVLLISGENLIKIIQIQ